MLCSFAEQLQKKLQQPLPGKKAQILMAPETRIESLLNEEQYFATAKPAAVLILFYLKDNKPHLVFIKRPTYDGVHSGQIAFPGGKYEETDHNLITTALREAEEEIGVIANNVQIIGQLTQLYIPPSNFLILPVVGFTEKPINFVLQPCEVDSILEIPFQDFLTPAYKTMTTITTTDKPFTAPCYKINNEIIWGATAMVISELCYISLS